MNKPRSTRLALLRKRKKEMDVAIKALELYWQLVQKRLERSTSQYERLRYADVAADAGASGE